MNSKIVIPFWGLFNFSAEYLDKINLRLRREVDTGKNPSDGIDDDEYDLESDNSDRPNSGRSLPMNSAEGLQNHVKRLDYDIK